MQIRKEKLEALAAKYQKKADEAYENYQATGTPRYDRAYRNAEDMADAFRAAAAAADEHMALINLRAELCYIAGRADDALAENAPKEKLAEILNACIFAAVVYCKYAKREIVKDFKEESVRNECELCD